MKTTSPAVQNPLSDTHLTCISELTYRVPRGGYGEYIYTELAHYGSKNECAITDTVFLPISEVCDRTVSIKFDGKLREKKGQPCREGGAPILLY